MSSRRHNSGQVKCFLHIFYLQLLHTNECLTTINEVWIRRRLNLRDCICSRKIMWVSKWRIQILWGWIKENECHMGSSFSCVKSFFLLYLNKTIFSYDIVVPCSPLHDINQFFDLLYRLKFTSENNNLLNTSTLFNQINLS